MSSQTPLEDYVANIINYLTAGEYELCSLCVTIRFENTGPDTCMSSRFGQADC